MRTLFSITFLILVVGAASTEDGKKALFSTWAPWFSNEEGEDIVNTKKPATTTMTSKRRKDIKDKPKEISAKKMKKIVDPKTIDGAKKKGPGSSWFSNISFNDATETFE